MSIHQSKKQSDLEKRLQLLRRQVYGKNSESRYTTKSAGQPIIPTAHQPTTISSDLNFLHQDLLKILVLSSLAIGSQIILFFLLKNNVLNLKFF